MKSAGWFAASIAFRTSGIRLVTPVEVSLCTTRTALNRWSVSASRVSWIFCGSAPLRQSPAMTVGLRPHFSASAFHSEEKWPVS